MNQCPACDHSFTKLEEFPLIYVAEFKKVELPPYIGVDLNFVPEKVGQRTWYGKTETIDNPLIPPAVFDALREGTKDVISFEGYIYQKNPLAEGYIDKSQDVTKTINTLVASPPVQSALSALENSVGKEVETKELLAWLQLHDGRPKYDTFSLDLNEVRADRNSNPRNSCEVKLCGFWEFTRGNPPFPGLRKTVGELSYEGRIRH